MPFAKSGGFVAIRAQHLCQGCRGTRNHPRITIPIDGPFGNSAGANPLVVATGQQRGAGGRTNRRGVEGIVTDALIGNPRERGRVDRPAVGVGQTEADIVQ